MTDERQLVRVLAEIQRRGGIGTQAIEDAIAHSERFVRAAPAQAQVVADLGSGGGLPGLVLAARRPHWTVHLVERRATRADLLRYGAAALGVADRTVVHAEDIAAFAVRRLPVELVTARSLGPLPQAVRLAGSVLGHSGWVLISEPPSGVREGADLADALADTGLVDMGAVDGIRRFRRGTPLSAVPRGTHPTVPARRSTWNIPRSTDEG